MNRENNYRPVSTHAEKPWPLFSGHGIDMIYVSMF